LSSTGVVLHGPFVFMPLQAMRGRGYYVFTYVPLSRYPMPTSALCSFHTNTKQISMKPAGRNYYHQ